MVKFKYFFIASVAITLFAYQKSINDVEPEVMTDDVWWGHEPDHQTTDVHANDVRPFRINITDQVIEDLKNRLSNTRSVVKPLQNINFEYGFNGDYLSKIVDHWLKSYDWTARQKYLNGLPQFKTKIFGLDLHFVHVKPALTTVKVRTIPLLMLHGWPGSFVEFYKIIPLLTRPMIDEYDFVFEVIAPSLPGFGFSDASAKPGMGPAQMGQVFVKLMERLGHKKFYIQGGDWGAVITETISKIFPDRVFGMHSNLCTMITSLKLWDYTRLALGAYFPSLIVSSEIEKTRTYPLSNLFLSTLDESGYMHLQMTKPDTAGAALNDSPAGLAAYILEKFSTFTYFNYKNLPDGGLSKFNIDELLDNIMVYWLTGSMTTAMRLYSEFATKNYLSLPHLKSKVYVPSACALFPREIPINFALKKLLKQKYVNLVSATEMEDGGHFAAFEQPNLLANDVWSSIHTMETMNKN